MGMPWVSPGAVVPRATIPQKVHWDQCLRLRPLWAGSLVLSRLSAASLVTAVCCPHPAATALCHIRLEIEIVCQAPEPFPLLCCCSSGSPTCAALIDGASLRGAGGWMKPEICQPGGFQGRPWLGYIGVTTLVVRACSWLSASRHPLYQQLFHGLLEGDVMPVWQGGSLCHLQLPAFHCEGAL